MKVELAGVPFEVKCRFPENEAFLKDYETDKAPLFLIAPTDEDLAASQAAYDRFAEERGKTPVLCDTALLERTSLLLKTARKLTSYDVLMVHGSALCMDGEGYLFIAPSGTGKSTHARLWRETFGSRVWMINDDKPVLKIENGSVTAYGTPWDGKHRLSRNASAPVKAMAWLYRDRENHIERLPKKKAFPFMAVQSYASEDPTVMTRIMNLEAKILNKVPFYALGCNMSAEAALTAWKGMKQM